MRFIMKLSRRFRCDNLLALSLFLVAASFIAALFLFQHLAGIRCDFDNDESLILRGHHKEQRTDYDKAAPLIFVGGWPRSGTTLMRAILDAHPDVRCGEETHIIPRILGSMASYFNRTTRPAWMHEAGITEEILLSATASFILEVIVRHGELAPRLCNKDPFTATYAFELSRMFPASQFILMIRDGRAVCYSVHSRSVGIGTLDTKNLTMCLIEWDKSLNRMYSACENVGLARCLPVYYEQLVLHPNSTLQKILEFLGVQWSDEVLRHQDHINKPGGISLSRLEPSTDQVIKPVNLDALTKWAEFIPEDVRRQIRQIAPMLEKLGYDPDAYPPDYGQPDKDVLENMLLMKRNAQFFQHLEWEVRNHSKV